MFSIKLLVSIIAVQTSSFDVKTSAIKSEELVAEDRMLTGYIKAMNDFDSWVFRHNDYCNHIAKRYEWLVTYFTFVEYMLDFNLNKVIAVLGNMKMDMVL